MATATTSPLLLLRSPLGDDTLPTQSGTLHAISLDASERISTPFRLTIEAVSDVRITDPNRLLAQPIGLTVRRTNGIDRLFHGIVREVGLLGAPERGRWHYRVTVVPRLWLLEQVSDCRIFQQKTVVEILEVLFAEAGLASYSFLVGAQPRREYTTQYNETNLRFAHRLMQECGLYYYFEFTETDHKLVVVDSNKAFGRVPVAPHKIVYAGDNVDIIPRWEASFETTYGALSLWDYDPEHPRMPVIGHQDTTLPTFGASRRTVYGWPAATTDDPVAADRARFLMEAAECASVIRSGSGRDPNFRPGLCFLLEHDPLIEESGVEYAVLSTRHRARDETWIAGGEAGTWSSEFTCFPREQQWREPRDLARPAMTGIYSGVVLGEPGEEIHADRLGRVKVRPLFVDEEGDREKVVADKAIWVRVLHAWSGQRWGWQHLPRVGTEVGLAFMNGDPDNPVVVGCFYNAEAMPPFAIPADQTRQGFRSHSTLHGGRDDYNELSFDDRKGEELVLLRAKRDQFVENGNDRTVVTERDDRLLSRSGDITVDAEAGSITISAAARITLQVGGASITLTPASIDIAVSSGVVPDVPDAIGSLGVDIDPILLDAIADRFAPRSPDDLPPTASINLIAAGDISTRALGAVATTAAGAITATAGGVVAATAGGAAVTTAGGDVNIEGSVVTIEALDGAVVCLPDVNGLPPVVP